MTKKTDRADRPAPAETLGQRIRRLREARGLTQQQLADELDIDANAIINWEHDRRKPVLGDDLRKLAAFLANGIDPLIDAVDLNGKAPPQPRGRPKRDRGKS